MEWWNDKKVKKMYAVGQAMEGRAIDGQVGGWMLEGIFTTKKKAIKHCTKNEWFVVPIPVGMLIGQLIPDGMFWPNLQSEAEGLERVQMLRKGLLLEENEEEGSGC